MGFSQLKLQKLVDFQINLLFYHLIKFNVIDYFHLVYFNIFDDFNFQLIYFYQR